MTGVQTCALPILFPKVSLITQNVDRLHHRAGASNVVELHGNIVENHCFSCKKKYSGETALPDKQIPKCPHCGGLIRPSVVWFGEMLPTEALEYAEFAANNCDLLFSVGTSAEVYPAANLPYIAKRSGATVVEVNPNITSLSHLADFKLMAPSGVALPKMLDEYLKYLKEKEEK